jgi:hypothetical protein
MVEKIKRMVLEWLLWPKLSAKTATVFATVLYRNILICMECVLVKLAHVTKG